MKASALVTIRSALMVAFLVAVPVVAMFGTSGLNPIPWLYPSTSGSQADYVPADRPQFRRTESPEAANRRTLPEAASLKASPSGLSRHSPQRGSGVTDAQTGLRTPTSTSQPGSDAERRGAERRGTLQAKPGREGRPDLDVTGRRPAGRPAGAGPSAEPAVDASTLDRLRYVERRLRELGATYYRLETWGADGRQYRFSCQVAAAERPDYQQAFQAVDGDWLGAMERVLGQVQTWRGSRPWKSPR